jgi:hypothetical protein
MHQPANALTAMHHDLGRVEALAASRPLDQSDTDVYTLITKVRDAIDELAATLEQRGH